MIALAHGLFLDDFLWLVIPVGLSLLVLRWAERRARSKAEAADANPEEGVADRSAPDGQ